MIRRVLSFVLLSWLTLVMVSCKSTGKATGSEAFAAGTQVTGSHSQQNPLRRTWPSAYPEPTSLRGLGTMVLKVYTDRGVPFGRISSDAFGQQIERQAVQTLQEAGITLVKETEAGA